jgi:regulator of PEP synthase PpsR (kinase-PPPase family)
LGYIGDLRYPAENTVIIRQELAEEIKAFEDKVDKLVQDKFKGYIKDLERDINKYIREIEETKESVVKATKDLVEAIALAIKEAKNKA